MDAFVVRPSCDSQHSDTAQGVSPGDDKWSADVGIIAARPVALFAAVDTEACVQTERGAIWSHRLGHRFGGVAATSPLNHQVSERTHGPPALLIECWVRSVRVDADEFKLA